MDITFEVMLPPRGASDFTVSAHPKWRVLSIVCVYYPVRVTDVVGMPRTGYIHVTGVPEPAAWAGLDDDQLRQRLCAAFTREGVGEKREWAVPNPAAIPAAARNALRTQRQVTVTWAQFKTFVRNLRRDAALDNQDLT